MKNLKNIWDLVEEYDILKSEYINNSILNRYFSSIKTELIEIVYQLNKASDTCNYKVYRLGSFRKIKYLLLRNFKEVLCIFSLKKIKSKIIKPSKLIFFIEHESHYNQYSGLKRELERQSVNYNTVFLNKTIYLKYKKLTHNPYYIGDFYTRINSLRSSITALYINGKLVFDSNLKNIGFEYTAKIKIELLIYNSKHLIENYKIHHALKSFITKETKRAVFFKAEGYKTKNIVYSCSENQIDTIAIQHGLIGKGIKYNELNINTYFVWSEIFVNILKDCNANCDKVPLGCPDYDKYKETELRKQIVNRGRTKKLIFLPNSGKSQTPESEIIFSLKTCLKFISKNSDFQLIIKPHPDGDNLLIKNIVEKFDINNVIILKKGDNLEYNNYDIVATMNSTIGIEAAIFRKPLIVILSSVEMLMVDEYLKYQIAEFVSSDQEMFAAVEKIQANYNNYQKKCEEFISDYLTNFGTAARKIVGKLAIDV